MTAPKTDALAMAAQMAKARRDAVAQQLAVARQAWVAAQLQLDQLEGYAQETTARWGASEARHAPEIMRHHYQFMDRLHHTIRMQTGILEQHAQAVSRISAKVREAEQKLEALRQVIASRDAKARQDEQRREQKAADELAAQVHRRGPGRASWESR
ncbi:flagellar export protein FliJ [Pseudacidovorax sp. NFM-22]|uniref:flagellar export protein FliJ n=1 Tax=Pseudacidovorax sp. NFM-22 TaxID=2744469 RepID=UPI001F40576B|nr:flagellar export protein FliJ [Pseudacidovorax sp. NFM-22]